MVCGILRIGIRGSAKWGRRIAVDALKACFANEMADAYAALGVGGDEVMRVFAMARKLNVPEAYLQPGLALGVAGYPSRMCGSSTGTSRTARLMSANRRYIEEESPR